MFLGALPENTPALYSLMNYSDIVGGTWYPKGGMTSVVKGMHTLAMELGVKFELNADVSKIEVEGNLAKQITTQTKHTSFDVVVSSADYHLANT